jgi:hypothetical protein
VSEDAHPLRQPEPLCNTGSNPQREPSSVAHRQSLALPRDSLMSASRKDARNGISTVAEYAARWASEHRDTDWSKRV